MNKKIYDMANDIVTDFQKRRNRSFPGKRLKSMRLPSKRG